MARLNGTNVAAPILPFSDLDQYATHLAKYGKGGYRTVETIEERNSISPDRLEEGMLVWVTSDPSEKHLYQYLSGSWVIFERGSSGSGQGGGIDKVNSLSDLEGYTGDFVYVISEETIYVKSDNDSWKPITSPSVSSAGIPIYTQEILDHLPSPPEDYITIPSESELYQPSTAGNGYYVDILFSAIRSLQAEVAKLRNSMRYGLYSYTGTDTAMSRVLSETAGEPEEPLWATSEEDLSPIDSGAFNLGPDNILTPADNIELLQGGLRVNGTARWEPDEDDGFGLVEDPKHYLYLTVSKKTLVVHISPEVELDFSTIIPVGSSRYNILVIVSRKKDNAGENFIWVSVAEYTTGQVVAEGYWNTEISQLTTRKFTLDTSGYTITAIDFTDLDLYKLSGYSKFQDFSRTVQPTTPSDEEYKYKVAHITIRSVSSLKELESIKDQLPKNELIYNEGSGRLYIKTDSGVKMISGGSGGGGSDQTSDSGMEKAEIIEWLASNGIVVTEEGGDLSISQIADITFVHQGTGKRFKFEADSTGNLHATELSPDYYEGSGGILSRNNFVISDDNPTFGIRGFVGTLGDKMLNGDKKVTDDHGLYSDRVKIGAIYAPRPGQTSFGCSHAYIELENTSDRDFLLTGCYLHYATENSRGELSIWHLPLEGVLPGGGTFLVRGKQYSDSFQANTYISVDTYDMEWYIGEGELIDLTVGTKNTYLLTYGLPDIDNTMILVMNNPDSGTVGKATHVYHPRYIDSVSIGQHITLPGSTEYCWEGNPDNSNKNGWICYNAQTKDCIYKNTFFLDPAKQAYQSSSTIDSSRRRNNTATDYQYVYLDKDVIEFPKTAETFRVDKYTPKASWEHKNVSSDKTRLSLVHPNMVTCSFGINIYTTRCFNWISAGSYDEYIWVRKKGEGDWSARFESYDDKTPSDSPALGISKVDFPEILKKAAYDRIHSTFPGDGTRYTSHKCILKFRDTAPAEPETWEYIVGRGDKAKNPDPLHTSEPQEFTLYPDTYTPRIFQITDQQGFHWIEYQAWGAAAEEVEKTILAAQEEENIIPILVNTGDMTQNGTRVNEWLDYYNAGQVLFRHLEQMNVVGNNDLCGTNPEVLGTGDDQGKSNGFYFHVFYCYEVDPDINVQEETHLGPVIPSSDAEPTYKYVPSFYYIDSKDHRFVFLNTEITEINCKEWYGRKNASGEAINVYTGWPISNEASATYDFGFTTIYSMIYNILDGARAAEKHIVAACHEMPFTVVTDANLGIGAKNEDRSINNGKSLVGCHANRMGVKKEKSIYWLSRLLENFEVKLMIGGHKHTYACTNHLREFYFYDSGEKNSLVDGPMVMEPTLANDDKVSWKVNMIASGSSKYVFNPASDADTTAFDSTKFPIMSVSSDDLIGINITGDGTHVWPFYGVNGSINPTGREYSGTTYFMCQATGYKLKSNKELPSPHQKFSYVIPKTTVGASSDSPSTNQLRPMFAEIVISGDSYDIYLYRVENILNPKNDKFNFSQDVYGTASASFSYLKGDEVASGETDKVFGNWKTEKTALISL